MKQNKIWHTLGILLISILLLSACSLSGNNQPVEESLPPELARGYRIADYPG